MQSNDGQRLNKFLALQLGISRREADALVEKKAVKLNDQIADLGQRVTENDVVHVDDKPVVHTANFMYLAFHKPVGYICSRKNQGDTLTIYELLPEKYHHLKPVGRLDKDSSGIIFLTNDGDFAHKMTHPKFHKMKVYVVELDKPLQPLHQQMISDFGVMLEDGKSQFGVARLADGDDTLWQITMSEGRNRQIRRTFSSIGYAVIKLHRTQFGIYELSDIPAGKYIELLPSSIAK